MTLGWECTGTTEVAVRTLTSILNEVVFTGPIDLPSVDVEGEELAVLELLDWHRWAVERCRAKIVLPPNEVSDHPVGRFPLGRGLRLTGV